MHLLLRYLLTSLYFPELGIFLAVVLSLATNYFKTKH